LAAGEPARAHATTAASTKSQSTTPRSAAHAYKRTPHEAVHRRSLRRACAEKSAQAFFRSAARLSRFNIVDEERFVDRWLAETVPEWEYIPEGWANRRRGDGSAWNRAAVASAYRKKWPAFVSALESGLLGIDHEVPEGEPIRSNDLAAHNTLVSFGYVLARASRNKDRISILDWGGATGHYFLISRTLMPEVELHYHCKEVPEVCAA